MISKLHEKCFRKKEIITDHSNIARSKYGTLCSAPCVHVARRCGWSNGIERSHDSNKIQLARDVGM